MSKEHGSVLLIITTHIGRATASVAMASGAPDATEREANDARVGALAHAADARLTAVWRWLGRNAVEPRRRKYRDSGLGFGISAARASREERVIPVTGQIPNPEPRIPSPSDRLFGTVERQEPSGSRLPLFAAAALIVMLGGALVFLNTSASNDHAATVAQVNHSEPLELVALGHARDVSVLTITGTVRNPSRGVKVEGLTAVISLLDRTGALVSTKDVPLDYRALGPGEEAPFKVSIPDPGSIARYRVSFRAGTDVVPHVDRRVDTKLASALQ